MEWLACSLYEGGDPIYIRLSSIISFQRAPDHRRLAQIETSKATYFTFESFDWVKSMLYHDEDSPELLKCARKLIDENNKS